MASSVGDQEHLEDRVNEELAIMEESVRPPKAFTADLFERPVAELCRRRVETIDAAASIGEAIRRMQAARTGALVVTSGGKLAGIVTERDVLMKSLPGDHVREPVSTIMTANPEAVGPDDEVALVMNLMHVGGYRHVPIVNDAHEPTHIVSLRDVLAFILDHFPREIGNIPTRPPRRAGEPWGG
jgi:CBS domain-containing protein